MHQQWRPLLRGAHPLFRQSSPWSEVLKQSFFGPQCKRHWTEERSLATYFRFSKLNVGQSLTSREADHPKHAVEPNHLVQDTLKSSEITSLSPIALRRRVTTSHPQSRLRDI